jgi:hypothetical protein
MLQICGKRAAASVIQCPFLHKQAALQCDR